MTAELRLESSSLVGEVSDQATDDEKSSGLREVADRPGLDVSVDVPRRCYPNAQECGENSSLKPEPDCTERDRQRKQEEGHIGDVVST